MNDEDLLHRVRSLHPQSQGEERAPHKPLLMLLALARVQRGEPRLVSFQELQPDILRLLEEFGVPRPNPQPFDPFWFLRNDGLWEIPDEDNVQKQPAKRKPIGSARPTLMGGFPAEIDSALRERPELLADVAQTVLDGHFPVSLHPELLESARLSLDTFHIRRVRARDPRFRMLVLEAYQHTCAFCGLNADFNGKPLGLVEAAHVRWHSHKGPDEVENGLALCSLHHKSFDRGALALDDEDRVMVSPLLSGSELVQAVLRNLKGRPLRKPIHGGLPQVEFRKWHRAQVFRAGNGPS